jgi:hypothetical protein
LLKIPPKKLLLRCHILGVSSFLVDLLKQARETEVAGIEVLEKIIAKL